MVVIQTGRCGFFSDYKNSICIIFLPLGEDISFFYFFNCDTKTDTMAFFYAEIITEYPDFGQALSGRMKIKLEKRLA